MAKRRTTRRKLPFFTALFPYLGGKRRLCPVIFREIDRLLPRRHWAVRTFLDGFLGGGSVSLYAKAMGFHVVATDIAERSITVGRALIENYRVRLTHEDVLRLLEPTDGPPGRIERELVPSVFTTNLGRFLDRALAVADESADPSKAALIRMLAVRLALLEHPMSQIRKGTIHRVSTGELESITESCVHHYVEGLRLTRPDRLWRLAQQINQGVFQGEGQVLKASIFDVLPTVEASVFYADPPYEQVMSYEREYKIIDQILEGAARPTSPFTIREGSNLIDELLAKAVHIPVWLLSFGNVAVTLHELEEKMRRLGRETRALEIRHMHLPAVATEEKKQRNREFLVVGWDPTSALFAGPPVRETERLQLDLTSTADDVHVALDAQAAAGRPFQTARSLCLQDAHEEGEPGVVDDPAITRRMDWPLESDHRLHLPASVRCEPAVDGDEKCGPTMPVAHAPSLPHDRPHVNPDRSHDDA